MMTEYTPDTQPQADRHGKYPAAQSVADFEQRHALVHRAMASACQRVGRAAQEVRLIAVSKTKDEDAIRSAYAAGMRDFGENKVQEAFEKWEAMADLTDINWAVIGHLQRNKAKLVARFAKEFHALDSLALARALDRRLQAEGRALDVFVQVNTSGEASKFGMLPEDALPFLQQMPAFSSLRVRGLMTLAMFSADASRVRGCFRQLRALRDDLRQVVPAGIDLAELSMGMSGDFELAIEEGATVVRVGQAIFGSRAVPDSHYWPG